MYILYIGLKNKSGLVQHGKYRLLAWMSKEWELGQRMEKVTFLWKGKVGMTPILGGMSISHMDAYMHKEHMSCEHFIGSKIRKRRRVGKLGDIMGISKK